jgi:hypothetical protein
LKERGEEPGAGLVTGAAGVRIRVHDVEELLSGSRRPWGGRQDQEATSAGSDVRPISCLYSLVILLITGDWQFRFCEMLARARVIYSAELS